ncbi:FAS1-like dehydratase domain-containing protein [Rhodococcus cercidiphylli]|uniref:MaoC family dehydratase N-terminal domain-containing protein n=1 Tax=Rhodococcus cercidiphylli TaxID=489916 RepID=A0ABU4AWK9_9NOCA|nr:MaoC family dehydratase N-terminal domain-containing protein [Rhodococcus cercidiphylli]MDV6230608.1 MaoC family dehydratase N-terminal domain-containing protein [Rhodococcus cercidiphylli]
MISPAHAHDPDRILDSVTIEVEAGKIREFARATMSSDYVYTDCAAAADAGFEQVLATPTHVVVAGHHRDQKGFVAALGLAIDRVVVGSVDWEYQRPLIAGDRITGIRRVVDDVTKESRRGGSMRLVTLETSWVDVGGNVVVTQREVLIEKGKK